jgi:hypothetical protein
MNLGATTGPLVAELLSGLVLLLLSYFDQNGYSLELLRKLTNPEIAVLILIGWLLGTFIDALRNLSEHLWDWHWLWNRLHTVFGWRWLKPAEINWNFFFRCTGKKLENLERYYWAFYILDADIAIAMMLFVVLNCVCRWRHFYGPFSAFKFGFETELLLLGIAGVFAIDAGSIRREIRVLLGGEGNAP